ncbi:hypothetical protein C1752_03692 [Acaryochloris thomasi RCC1774]|uniref:AB hydrolase-1 domain-containing protein n=1 Tax=Acaryochloris thomasi RCC1774 TaxID=1764569 RepID=A0A2W1JF85_9CYAN|nr:alpha/beta hydrolase [Acaryochloris thomasi]PZD72403.1 hypothetical protein C1752_03692 [Acaryochloris thomasi RCC1774]
MPSPVPLPRRKSLPSRQLIKAGKIALLLWLTLIVIALVSYWLGMFPILQLPLRPFGVFLAISGLICGVSGWLCGRPTKKQIVGVVCIVFIGLNMVAFTGAYALTHSPTPGQWGLGRPKPQSSRQPTDLGLAYTSHRIRVNKAEWIETWLIPNPQPQGTVLLFPGNHGTKGGQLLPPAQVFHDLGYSCLLVDFRGAGGSSGYKTSVGFWEAEDVALALQQAQQLNLPQPLILYGVSMGTAAILRAMAVSEAPFSETGRPEVIATHKVQPAAIILELPFSRLTQAIRSRLSLFPLPTSPMAELLVFWGGIQQGFNGFTHDPITYAKQITAPSLILQGQQDPWTTLAEIEALQKQFRGPTQRVVFPTAGHQLLVTVDPDLWRQEIDQFLRDSRS